MSRRRADRLIAVAIVVVALASACSSGSGDPVEPITVFGNQRGPDAAALREVLARFEDETGIDVRFTGTASFPRWIRERLEDGNAPDIGLFPEPGLLDDLAAEGYVLPLRADVAAMGSRLILPSLGVAFGAGETPNGVLFQVNVKSLVWYPPAEFTARGYEVPTTWAELEALMDRMASDGLTPWCMGVSAFDATGWPATDWVEDVVLRMEGPGVYDAWSRATSPSRTTASVRRSPCSAMWCSATNGPMVAEGESSTPLRRGPRIPCSWHRRAVSCTSRRRSRSRTSRRVSRSGRTSTCSSCPRWEKKPPRS